LPLSSIRLPLLVATRTIRSGDAPIRTNPYTALVVGASDRRTHKELLVPLSRPVATLVSLVLMGLALVVLLPPECASACSCAMPPGNQKQRAERALSSSEAVFSGKVVKIDRPSGPSWSSKDFETDTFRVSESWKGPEGGMLEVKTPIAGMSCGYLFKEGQEYLVYASEWQQGLKVYLCGETKLLSKAGADLALLGNSEKPKDGGDALNDTSGVVPAHAVVGLAGLAMAASLLLVMVRLVRSR
jgi:hypothetical protein